MSDRVTIEAHTCDGGDCPLCAIGVLRVDPEPDSAQVLRQLKEAQDHAKLLDGNWSSLHNVSMQAIRDALAMPEATVPEMVSRIRALRGQS